MIQKHACVYKRRIRKARVRTKEVDVDERHWRVGRSNDESSQLNRQTPPKRHARCAVTRREQEEEEEQEQNTKRKKESRPAYSSVSPSLALSGRM